MDYDNRRHELVAARDRNEMAQALSTPGCLPHPLWPAFAEAGMTACRALLVGWDADQVGFTTGVRAAAMDYEVIILGQGDKPRPIDYSQPMAALPFLMHFVDGHHWLIARVGADTLPVSGWPPEFPRANAMRRLDR